MNRAIKALIKPRAYNLNQQRAELEARFIISACGFHYLQAKSHNSPMQMFCALDMTGLKFILKEVNMLCAMCECSCAILVLVGLCSAVNRILGV